MDVEVVPDKDDDPAGQLAVRRDYCSRPRNLWAFLGGIGRFRAASAIAPLSRLRRIAYPTFHDTIFLSQDGAFGTLGAVQAMHNGWPILEEVPGPRSAQLRRSHSESCRSSSNITP